MTRMNPVERVENCLRNATEWTSLQVLAQQAQVNPRTFSCIARQFSELFEKRRIYQPSREYREKRDTWYRNKPITLYRRKW
jgi:hypothetical protein